MAATTQRKRIVILGGGFGGAYCAQALEKQLRDDTEILLLDRHNYFVFYPLLVEAGTGGLEPRHAVVSIRAFLNRTRFRMAEVMEVDTSRRTVTYRMAGMETSETVGYDHLVVALGSVTRFPEVPGLSHHGFELKSLSDAVVLRDRAIQLLEAADALADAEKRRALLRFVVVGGNFTGVEVAGEFHVFLRQATRYYPNVRAEECSVVLVEIADRILPALDADLSRYALEKLRARGVDIRLRASVREVGPDSVTLDNGERVAAHTTIWCAGIAPSPLIGRLGLPTDDRGYILCDPDLRVRGMKNVWAIGDCAVNPGPDGRPYPATAQHAVRQGIHLAQNLARVLRGLPAVPCVLKNFGALAAIGCRTAVAKIFGMKLSGFPAWFLWRTVYLLKMPRVSRRLRIALDWTMDLLFTREYVELGVHRATRTNGSTTHRGTTENGNDPA